MGSAYTTGKVAIYPIKPVPLRSCPYGCLTAYLGALSASLVNRVKTGQYFKWYYSNRVAFPPMRCAPLHF